MQRLSLVVVAWASLGGAGCTPEEAPATYANGVKDIIDGKCANCHHVDGIGPMPLTTYKEIEPFLAAMEGDVRTRNMPPWPAAPHCNTYANDFSLTDDERATLLGWFEADAPEGKADGAALAASGEDPRASGIRVDTVIETSGAFSPTKKDEYRCYAMLWPYDTEKYVTGFDLIPGEPSNVHHANVFVNPPSAAEEFLGYEAEDAEPGYNCNEGSSVQFPTLLGSWAPGASGLPYPKGTGQLVLPGSVVTIQVHYAGPGEPDLSSLALQIEDHVEKRAYAAPFWWFNYWEQGGMPIPQGEVTTHDVEISLGLELAAAAPWFQSSFADAYLAAIHMHGLGSAGELSIHSPAGDTCLLKIDHWDFHRQMGYVLAKPVELYLPEDKLYLSCTWDNTEGTRNVNWGLGTDDEMCMGFTYLVPK